VLAALLLELNRPVSLASIIDAVWGQEPPRDARNCVYTYVSRLRRALRLAEAPGGKRSVLVSAKAGYQLSGDPGQVDVVTFERQCATARDCYRCGDKEAAAEAISVAMSLWGGEPFAGLAGPRVEAERVRLVELHLAALELLAEIRLDGPGAAEVAAELSALVREYPLRERLRELLMLALYRAGRQGDALRAFQDLRAVLTEDLGVEPGPRSSSCISGSLPLTQVCPLPMKPARTRRDRRQHGHGSKPSTSASWPYSTRPRPKAGTPPCGGSPGRWIPSTDGKDVRASGSRPGGRR
jgi:DNA-binding SARP family transcriptional activator